MTDWFKNKYMYFENNVYEIRNKIDTHDFTFII
jgi:hypothetical protein